MFKLLTKIPILGIALRVFNSYAYDGDYEADGRFAGVLAWSKAYFFPVTISLIVAMLLMPDLISSFHPRLIMAYKVQVSPGELATSILPNLLGFGIGVYALIFALDRRLLQDLQEGFEAHNKKNKVPGSALLLNTEMALPLVAITLAIVIGIFQKIFSESPPLKMVSWFSLWLSLYFTLDLINNLFLLGNVHLTGKIKKENSEPYGEDDGTP